MTRLTRNQVRLCSEPAPSSTLADAPSAISAPKSPVDTSTMVLHTPTPPSVVELPPVEEPAPIVVEGDLTSSELDSSTGRPKRKPTPVVHYRDTTQDSQSPKSPTTKKRTKSNSGDNCTAKRPRQSSAEAKAKTPRTPRRSPSATVDSTPPPPPTHSSSGLDSLVAAAQPFSTIPTFVATPKAGDWTIYDSIWNPVQFDMLSDATIVPSARETGEELFAVTKSTPRKRVRRIREQEAYPEIASQAFLKDDRIRSSPGQATPRGQQGTYSSLLLSTGASNSSYIITSRSTSSHTSASSTLSSPSPSIFDLDFRATSTSVTSSPPSSYLGSPPPKSRHNPSPFIYGSLTEQSLRTAGFLGGRGGVVILEERKMAFGHPISCERGTF